MSICAAEVPPHASPEEMARKKPADRFSVTPPGDPACGRPASCPRSIVIGAAELTLVPDGEMLRPSGEGVYSVPAKDGWGDYTPPDDNGDIAVMPHSLLVRGPLAAQMGIALVDTGGDNPDEVPSRKSDFLEQLAALGVCPEGGHPSYHFSVQAGGDTYFLSLRTADMLWRVDKVVLPG